MVPDSVADPLGYYRNNTVNSRALIETAVKTGVRHFIFSSTAAVYGNPLRTPINEDDVTIPMSPYGSSKLMTEIMLRDAGAAHGLSYLILRYFNVAGADPAMRTGQSTKGATHLIKVAVETALGLRPQIEVFGTDYETPDGTCIRDYIHVSDLVRAHSDALRHLRGGGASVTLNCGYGRGFSVLEVIDTVKRVSGVDFKVVIERPASRRSAGHRGGFQAHPRPAGLGAAIRRPRDHRRPCAEMGASPRRRQGSRARRPARSPRTMRLPDQARAELGRPGSRLFFGLELTAQARDTSVADFDQLERFMRANAPCHRRIRLSLADGGCSNRSSTFGHRSRPARSS